MLLSVGFSALYGGKYSYISIRQQILSLGDTQDRTKTVEALAAGSVSEYSTNACAAPPSGGPPRKRAAATNGGKAEA